MIKLLQKWYDRCWLAMQLANTSLFLEPPPVENTVEPAAPVFVVAPPLTKKSNIEPGHAGPPPDALQDHSDVRSGPIMPDRNPDQGRMRMAEVFSSVLSDVQLGKRSSGARTGTIDSWIIQEVS